MLSEFAPAKVNLFLSAIRKRKDDYHDIGTMFHTVSCGDTLFGELDSSGEISVSYSRAQDYPPENDLIYKAAVKLKEQYRVSGGVRFYLEKNLPQAAGLGGGSSDAAAALRLLVRLWGLKVSATELEKTGALLGADVPFFIKGGAAMAEGIGEILMPQSPIDSDSCIVVIATPWCRVSTAIAYGNIVPMGKTRWQNFMNGAKSSKSANPLDDSWDLFNQFEDSILKKYPLISSLRQELNSFGGKSLLAGSGSSIFSLFSSMENAVKACNSIKDDCRFLRITKFYDPSKNLSLTST